MTRLTRNLVALALGLLMGGYAAYSSSAAPSRMVLRLPDGRLVFTLDACRNERVLHHVDPTQHSQLRAGRAEPDGQSALPFCYGFVDTQQVLVISENGPVGLVHVGSLVPEYDS